MKKRFSEEQIIVWRGKPVVLRYDNGPEYVGEALRRWAERHMVELTYIQPGKP